MFIFRVIVNTGQHFFPKHQPVGT